MEREERERVKKRRSNGEREGRERVKKRRSNGERGEGEG